MNPKIEISSLIVNKLKNSNDDFIKYDIDVALEEVEGQDSNLKLKYKFALLSNPTNTKIVVEGFVSVNGNETEIAKQLERDERNIPLVVNLTYQEIFPLIFMLAKSMGIPCPAYKLAQISAKQGEKNDKVVETEQNVEKTNVETANLMDEIKTEEGKPSLESSLEEMVQEP